jgi:hypothetical protein
VITTDEIGSTPKTLKMWDISDLPSIPTSPAATYTSNPGRTEHNVTIRGNYAYVAWYDDGVQVVNVTDPAAPTDAGGFNQTGNLVWGVYPFFPSGKIIGGDMVTGLWTFSFSDLAPRVPVSLQEPADNDSVSAGNPVTFRWTKAANLDADPHYYEVHLTGPDVDTTWQANDSTTTFSDVGHLIPGNSYFWTVLTRDEWNTTFSPDTFQFSVGDGPLLVVTASGIDFDTVLVGNTGTDTLVVQNLGNATLEVTSITIDSSAFSTTAGAMSIPPGGSASVPVVFAPDQARSYSGTLTLVSNSGNSPTVVTLQGIGEFPTSVGPSPVPERFLLMQNYPNPFNPSTVITYDLATSTKVTLAVYNLLGQQVATPVNRVQSAGKYQVEFNATGLPSGVYFYKLTAGSFVSTRKMILTR